MKYLEQWTGTRWVVTISQEQGEPTLAEQDAAAEQRLLDAAEQLPVVQAVKEAFPGAVVRKVTPRKEFTDAEDEPAFLEAPEDPDDDEDDDERIFE
jgi:DNA polymerase-3 subunit gamma/tau